VKIKQNTFDSNKATNGDGGAIKFTSFNTNVCSITIQNNTFTSNHAGTKGGAISWDFKEPSQVEDNTFTSNSATIYGSKIGSIGESLVVISKSEFDANVNTNGDVAPVMRRRLATLTLSSHQSGTKIDTQYLAIVDKYGYIVKYGNVNNIEASMVFSSVNGFTAALTGIISYEPTNGVTKIENLVLTSAPETNQIIEFTSKDLLVTTTTLNIAIEVRSCISGEQLTASGA
jgi:predicted outer membrane repeat protein